MLGGSGTSVQWEGEETLGYAVRAGDCIVHLRARERPHPAGGRRGSRRARVRPADPRRRRDVAAPGGRRVARGDLGARRRRGGPPLEARGGGRAARVRSSATSVRRTSCTPTIVEAVERDGATVGRRVRDLGRAAGSQRTGLRLADVLPGKLNAPPHCHSAEEEIFVVLEGEGSLLLWEEDDGRPSTRMIERGLDRRRPPAGTGRRARLPRRRGRHERADVRDADPNDVCYYPRSGKIMFTRGRRRSARLGEPLGLLGRARS